MAPDRERSRSPMGRAPLPATVMNVKMCCAKCEEKAKEECEEVEGVVKVVAKQSENKVIVYGAADPSALLKKMRRHLDKHAMYWPMDETNQDQVAPPLFPVDPREMLSQNRGGGAPLQAGTILPVDPRDGRPLGDSREVRQVERELKDAEIIRERAGGAQNVPREVISHGAEGPREVVFVPVDAKDGTPVDPRTVRKVEPAAAPREGRPVQVVDARDLVRPVERMELRGEHPRDPNHGAPGPAPREVVFIPVDAKDGTPVDPRRVHQVDPRDGRPLDPLRVDAAGRPITPPHARPGHGQELREVRPIHDPRDLGNMPPVELRGVRPVDPREGPVDVSELRPIDPRNMVRHGDVPREVQRRDPHGRTSEPLDHRDDLRPVDPRMVRQIDPHDGRPALDPRDMDPRDGRAVAAAYGPSEVPRGGMRGASEGLVPVRTGRDAREVHFTPSRNNLSPTHGPRDMGPRSPGEAEYASRRPRQHAPDYEPRSPRGDAVEPEYGPRSPREYSGGAEYGPRSPRSTGAMDYSGPRSPGGRAADYDPVPQRAPAMRPALDRELSFNAFGPSHDTRGGPAALEHGPYEPVDPRDAAAFDFHGGASAHPRSPRSGGQPQPVRGYGDIDPRQFRPQAGAEPRVLLDVTHELRGGHRDPYINDPALRDRDDAMHYSHGGGGGGLLGGSPRRPQPPHVSQYSEFRRGEADTLREYQPKESYFSDYHPSQNYQPGPLATQAIDDPVTNPNYQKHLSAGYDQF